MQNFVSNETGELRKLTIHSPDSGIGKVIPTKLHEWLYDDTVDLQRMRQEYDEYVELLLFFLDPEKAAYLNDYKSRHSGPERSDVYKPTKDAYFDSDKVVDIQMVLADILEDYELKIRMVSAVCALEGCSRLLEKKLELLPPRELANVLITGVFHSGDEEQFIFPPLPNLVFTRDIAIMIKDHLLLSKSATAARRRESILTRYVAYNHPLYFKDKPEKIIEITEEADFFLEDKAVQERMNIAIEGGDIMMISPHHLIIGVSERTTPAAADAIIKALFERKALDIRKVSIVQIPEDRAQMHIDTIFTQIAKDKWVLFGEFSERLHSKVPDKLSPMEIISGRSLIRKAHHTQVIQFIKQGDGGIRSRELEGIEDLMYHVSTEDYGVASSEVKIVYSGGNQFPYDEREQWTDSCNLLALREGVVVGYDRNTYTSRAMAHQLGFRVITAGELLTNFRSGTETPSDVRNTLILLSSSELSRARGGSHCMSMPLSRMPLS